MTEVNVEARRLADEFLAAYPGMQFGTRQGACYLLHAHLGGGRPKKALAPDAFPLVVQVAADMLLWSSTERDLQTAVLRRALGE